MFIFSAMNSALNSGLIMNFSTNSMASSRIFASVWVISISDGSSRTFLLKYLCNRSRFLSDDATSALSTSGLKGLAI